MTLITCRECGKEVSSEAPTCPHCGIVINKKSNTAPIVLIILIMFIAGVIYSNYESKQFSPYAACDNPESIKEFKSLFDNGAYAQKNKLRVIDAYNVKDVSKGEELEKRACIITFSLNTGQVLTYKLTYKNAKGNPDGYIMVGSVIKSKRQGKR